MKRITKIENQRVEVHKKRVAAYCRVSTNSDEQLVSLEAQKQHYEKYINANSNWSYAGIYYDEGISGTGKEKRTALLKLISDCEDGRIDMIVTKSISRFARNTTDCLELVRRLAELDVYIFFEKENINTENMEGELMLTILSSLAEEESMSISQNAKWSIKKRFEKGSYTIANPPYGYRNNDGEMEIVQEEAEVVRDIFCAYLSGNSISTIAKDLNRRNVRSRKGGPWSASTISGMLKNEKYTGDVVLQKTWTDEHFKRHANYGEVDQYVIQNHHEPIIAKEEFVMVQDLIAQHLSERGGTSRSGKYLNRYPFSGKIVCGECGASMTRKIYKRAGGRYIRWACANHIEDKNCCSMKAVEQAAIEAAFATMMNKLVYAHKSMLIPLRDSLKSAEQTNGFRGINTLENKMEENAQQRSRLRLLLTQGLLDAELFNTENNVLLSEYRDMETGIADLKMKLNSDLQRVQALERLMSYTARGKMLEEYAKELFLEHVDHVTVYSLTKFEFSMKCGLTLIEEV